MAGRTTALQRFGRALVRRIDAVGAPPAPVLPVDGTIADRLDAIRNNVIGFGVEDKVSAGRPDVYSYPLEFMELTALYRYGGHSRRFVEVVPNDATRKGWSLKAEGDVVPGIDAEHKRLALFANVCKADTWARLYGAALIVMVTREDWKGTEWELKRNGRLAQPLDLKRVLELRNLVVLDKSQFQATAYDTNFESPSFGRPIKYRINANVGGVGDNLTGAEVHASRVLYFEGAALPPSSRYENDGCGDSILQAVWSQMRDMGQMGHALATLATELRISVLKMRGLAAISTSDQAEAFKLRMKVVAFTKSILNMVLLGDDEEYEHKQGTVAGMSELATVTRQELQAVTAMPEQLWIGNSPSGLSTDGESHRNLWANVISSYQVVKYDPVLTVFYAVLFAARLGPWAGQTPAKWTLEWEPLDELTENGKATLRKTVADTDTAYVAMGALDPERVTKARFGKKGWQADIPPEDDVVPGLNMAAIGAALGEDPTAEGAPADVAGTAMNGAQAAALQGMIESVAAKTLPLGALAPMIRASFPLLDQSIIDAIVASFAPPAPLPGTLEDMEDDEGEPQLSAAEALAAMLTEHQITRCEHGSLNRCRLCGIERERALKLGANGAPMLDAEGSPMWETRWTAIGKGPEPAPGVIKVDSKSIRVYIRELAVRHADRHRNPWTVPRTDAADGLVAIWVGLPLPESAVPAWRAAQLEAAVIAGVTPDDLDDRGHDPHVTLFWAGKVPAVDAAVVGARVAGVLDKLLAVTATTGTERTADFRALELDGCGLSAFRPSTGSEGDTPLVLSLNSDALFSLNDQLSNELLDEEERRRRPWFVPHATVGYFAGDLKPEQWAQLYAWRGGRGTWTTNTIELHVGEELAARWTLAERA